eukprot:TRINITY_DN5686_c0_g1_i2.p1 TRINITY_DN5686_c0_g1~~TRINITY_DN5686_c0_g1_i2.p1  ORF type:complete len:197 (-),score=40.48 TRINITY_DN5686_c0_g1_i2:107-697(-)
MGNNPSGTRSTNNKVDLDDLVQITHFDENELQKLHKQFLKETPTGVINKREFSDVMKAMLVSDGVLQDLVFNAFDKDKDGVITFKEFCVGLSVLLKGTPEEKLEFSFSTYDLNGDGFITRDDLETIVFSMQPLVGQLTMYNGKKYDSPLQLVDDFFAEIDLEGTGKISLEMYKEGSLKNFDIFQALKLLSDGLPKS